MMECLADLPSDQEETDSRWQFVREDPGSPLDGKEVIIRHDFSTGSQSDDSPTPVKKGEGCVMILDDDPIIRNYLNLVLTSSGYATKLFSRAEEFFAQAEIPEQACLLLDVRMPEMEGPAVQKRLAQTGWVVPIVFISAHAVTSVTVKGIQSGALDFLQKPLDSAVVLEAVKKALSHARETHRKQRELHRMEALYAELTEREREVFTWVIAGRLNKQIGLKLGITERTVKAHRASVMGKLEASSVVHLVRIADQLGVRPAKD